MNHQYNQRDHQPHLHHPNTNATRTGSISPSPLISRNVSIPQHAPSSHTTTSNATHLHTHQIEPARYRQGFTGGTVTPGGSGGGSVGMNGPMGGSGVAGGNSGAGGGGGGGGGGIALHIGTMMNGNAGGGGGIGGNHHSDRNERSNSSDGDNIKETQTVSPAYDTYFGGNGGSTMGGGQYSDGYSGRHGQNHHGNGHGNYMEKDTTLSTFLSKAFAQLKQALGTHPSRPTLFSKKSSSSLFKKDHGLGGAETTTLDLAAWALPSPSTIGFIFLCILWYLSSAFSSNTGKSILTQFRYPVTLTFVQFAFVAGYCVALLALRERTGIGMGSGVSHGHPLHGHHAGLRDRRGSLGTAAGWGIKKPNRTMFKGTFIMSLFQIAGHVFSSMAIARVPVSTVHTIKALSPLFTVVSYAAMFRVRYSSATYLALLPLTLGVMLACSFDLRANAVGFLCALGSTVIFVSQNIFSKKLLPKESSGSGSSLGESSSNSGNSSGGAGTSGVGVATGAGKLDKLNLLFYSSGMAFFLMIPIWIYSDAGALISAWFADNGSASSMNLPIVSKSGKVTIPMGTGSLLLFFFMNGTVHFAQNLLAFSILARTSPVTYSIASLIKRIAVICIAIIWSGQTVTFVQGTGMLMTFGGLAMYNRAKGDVEKGERKRVIVEKRMDMFLPTTALDARLMDGHTETPPSEPQEKIIGLGLGVGEAYAGNVKHDFGVSGGGGGGGGVGGGGSVGMMKSQFAPANTQFVPYGSAPPRTISLAGSGATLGGQQQRMRSTSTDRGKAPPPPTPQSSKRMI